MFVLFNFVVFGFVFSVLRAKRSDGKNVSEMILLCRVGREILAQSM